MGYEIQWTQLPAYVEEKKKKFETYYSGFINDANRYGKGTKKENVGVMFNEFKRFCKTVEKPELDSWTEWYNTNHKGAIKKATNDTFAKLQEMRRNIKKIKKADVEKWIRDLVITKSFNGLYLQREIIKFIADQKNATFRESTEEEEESKGIDGYIDNVAYSVKPDSYKQKRRTLEKIEAKMIYYTKTKTSLKIEVEE